jgi:uncharacterized protein YqeY
VSITDRVQTDMTAAAKTRDQRRLAALRLVLDALKKAAKEERGELDEPGEIGVLKRERKRRAEAAAGRAELAAAEEAEGEVIDDYLPDQISDAELETLVNSALEQTGARSPAEMGKVMAAAMSRVGGRADGKRVSELVREKLNSGEAA